MKTFLLVMGVTFFLMQTQQVLADIDEHDDHEQVAHYISEKPENKTDALSLLSRKVAEIETILSSAALTDSNLEAIHEVSYSLEAAVDKLREFEDKAGASALDDLDESVQALHYASEKHQEQETREWFAKLKPAAEGIKNVFRNVAIFIVVITAMAVTQTNVYADRPVYEIVIKDHMFEPTEITVPAGQKIKLVVHNQDPTPEEFESDDFAREKIINGNSKATIFVGPLEPGKYHFFGEFNLDTANGYLIAE